MTTNHTPTPWYVTAQSKVEGITGEELARSVAYKPRDGVTYVIAEWSDPKDAAHIVRCVNSHDVLVEALTSILSARPKFEELADGTQDRCVQYAMAMGKIEHIARAALRAATGE